MLPFTLTSRTGQWSAPIFACLDDCNACLYGSFCPFCAQGEAWAAVRGDESCTLVHCCCAPSAVWTRTHVRYIRGISPDPGCDALFVSLLPCCAVCQNLREARELRAETFGRREPPAAAPALAPPFLPGKAPNTAGKAPEFPSPVHPGGAPAFPPPFLPGAPPPGLAFPAPPDYAVPAYPPPVYAPYPYPMGPGQPPPFDPAQPYYAAPPPYP
jgi:Cys-rich protein (TIGR01571 family)